MREQGHQPVIIFVTICAQRRKQIFAREEAVKAILGAWAEADAWAVGRYVILPDHLHLFCTPRRAEVSLARWSKYWKALVSRRWPWAEEQPIWQEDFWDTQLRQGESYAAKWEYVRNNPVRHGLVERPEEWPPAGEIEVLAWHDR